MYKYTHTCFVDRFDCITFVSSNLRKVKKGVSLTYIKGDKSATKAIP